MKSFFAPAAKAGSKKLAAQIEILSAHPVVSGLLYSINGLLAVLNEQRQIVAVNDSLLQMLNLESADEALGLRPGEALQCTYVQEESACCGTTKMCSSCGAAIAIVSSLEQNKPVERICALTTRKGDEEIDLALQVRSQPILIDGERFLLLFLQDVTLQQQRAALERTFFHDINNMLAALEGASELLVRQTPIPLAKNLHQAAVRLHKEIAIQRCLTQTESCSYQPLHHRISAAEVLKELKNFFSTHPAAQGKSLQFTEAATDAVVITDSSLLLRVLCNMVINALEATESAGSVRVWSEADPKHLTFHVWNNQTIPAEVARRIFQRNFSTKEQVGRGIGTFSMKFFGEKILGGKVNFHSSQKQGTTFSFSLPR